MHRLLGICLLAIIIANPGQAAGDSGSATVTGSCCEIPGDSRDLEELRDKLAERAGQPSGETLCLETLRAGLRDHNNPERQYRFISLAASDDRLTTDLLHALREGIISDHRHGWRPSKSVVLYSLMQKRSNLRTEVYKELLGDEMNSYYRAHLVAGIIDGSDQGLKFILDQLDNPSQPPDFTPSEQEKNRRMLIEALGTIPTRQALRELRARLEAAKDVETRTACYAGLSKLARNHRPSRYPAPFYFDVLSTVRARPHEDDLALTPDDAAALRAWLLDRFATKPVDVRLALAEAFETFLIPPHVDQLLQLHANEPGDNVRDRLEQVINRLTEMTVR